MSVDSVKFVTHNLKLSTYRYSLWLVTSQQYSLHNLCIHRQSTPHQHPPLWTAAMTMPVIKAHKLTHILSKIAALAQF